MTGTMNKVCSDGNNDEQGDVWRTTTNKMMWGEQRRTRSIRDGNNGEQGLCDGNNDKQGDVVGTTTNKVMWWEQRRTR